VTPAILLESPKSCAFAGVTEAPHFNNEVPLDSHCFSAIKKTLIRTPKSFELECWSSTDVCIIILHYAYNDDDCSIGTSYQLARFAALVVEQNWRI
jgi:hypothetical protein